jgi:uncharacterized protein DUF4129
LLLALRYGWVGWLLRRIEMALPQGRNAGASAQIASRMYAEMLQVMSRHGYSRNETQTPFEFAADVKAPSLSSLVEEFTLLYASARFGGVTCDVARLQELLGTIRADLRAR